jgi:hypothetical protein
MTTVVSCFLVLSSFLSGKTGEKNCKSHNEFLFFAVIHMLVPHISQLVLVNQTGEKLTSPIPHNVQVISSLSEWLKDQ